VFRIIYLTALITALWTAAAYANASNCAPTETVEMRLKIKYGETVQAIGSDYEVTILVRFWANTETGTWTVTQTAPDIDLTCVVGSGHNWMHEANAPHEIDSAL
jgi:hypothetical protein